jgi:hypothetical protein
VKLVRVKDPPIVLQGLTDFADFVNGAESAGAELNDDIDKQGIAQFLDVYRKAFAKRVAKRSKFPPTVNDLSGPTSPGFGQFSYIPLQQTLAEYGDGAGICGIECLASSMVNALMCLGLINPTMERHTFETRYTSIGHGKNPADTREIGPTSEDGVHLDGSAHNATLRGMDNVNSLIPVRAPFGALRALEQVFSDFQGTDWAQLMGMSRDLASLKVKDLREADQATAAPYLEQLDATSGTRVATNTPKGCGIAFYTLKGVLYLDSQHFVTLHADVTFGPGAHALVCAENDRKRGNASPAEINLIGGIAMRLRGGLAVNPVNGRFDLDKGMVFVQSAAGRVDLGRLLYTVEAQPR